MNIPTIHPPTKVYVKESNIPNAGRGVFAKESIKKGETIEVSPVVRIERDDPSITNSESIVPHYVFTFKEGYEGFALGYGSLYNHNYDPNALYDKNDELLSVVFTARRDIAEGEEITVTYNNSDPSDTSTPMNRGVLPYGEA